MRGARRAETTEDGSDTDENGINAAMCINAWTRVRHWSAPERVPVVGTSEEAGTMTAMPAPQAGPGSFVVARGHTP